MEQREIGQAQAWSYPLDRTAVLWECYVHDWARQEDPTKDETLTAVWTGFERFLLERLHGVERIVTPSFEPIYETPGVWHAFLEARGYRQLNERAFVKEVAGT